jgi:nucleoside-diphosphate-sugar epimerase
VRKAFVLGGTGFVGRHVARHLAEGGWDVTIGSRGQTELPVEVGTFKQIVVDRSQPDSLRSATSNGFDVLVDVIPYEIEDAHQLVGLGDAVGSVVAISTTSVYADDEGRTLDEATGPDDFPRLPVPILETQRRARPGDQTYSTKKVAIEDVLLGQSDVAVCVIRPCAIYGSGDTQCREWFFIKRALDRRPFVLLADEGETVFHTTSVHNLAEMIRLAAEQEVHGAFNCGDPDPPNVRTIARSIANAMGHQWEEILLPREVSTSRELRNPWGGFHPWIVSMDKAHDELEYEPVTTYDDAIAATVEWAVAATRGRDWMDALPKAADYLGAKFDYAFEDRFVEEFRGSSSG